MGRISTGVFHIGRDPVPGRWDINEACAAAIGTHVYQTIVIAVTGIILLANRSRVRLLNYQRIDHNKTAAYLQRTNLHAINAKGLRGGALVIL